MSIRRAVDPAACPARFACIRRATHFTSEEKPPVLHYFFQLAQILSRRSLRITTFPDGWAGHDDQVIPEVQNSRA